MVNHPWLQMARSTIFALSIIAYLTYRLGNIAEMAPIISILSFISILIALPNSGKAAKVFAFLFIGFGSWFVLQEGISLYQYLLTFGEMLYLISFFAIVPLLAVPIHIGKYDIAIGSILERKQRTKMQFYRLISLFSFLLSSFLNLATLPIVYQSVKESAKKIVSAPHTSKFLTMAIMQGYAITIAWTPLSGVVGVVFEITKVSWLSLVPILFSISLLGLLMNWLIYAASERLKARYQSEVAAAAEPPQLEQKATATQTQLLHNGNPYHKIIQITFVIILLIGTIASLNHWLELGIVVTGTLIAIPFAFVWSLLLKQGSAFMKEMKQYFVNGLPKMSDQFVIFLGAGFFVTALHYSGYNHAINEAFLDLNHLFGAKLFLLIIPLITLFFSFLGMHPIAAITVLAESLNPVILGLTPEQLSVALIGGSVMTFMIGPFSGTIGLLSTMINRNAFEIVSWNLMYCVGCYLLVAVILVMI